jgi:phosphoglycerate dehydrogenase-like enzyme
VDGIDGSTRRVVVTFPVPPEMRDVMSEALGASASVAFLAELAGQERTDALRAADAVLCWNLRRELQAEDERAAIRTVPFVQLLSAGADQVPFEDVAETTVVASNVGAYAEPMAEHVMAMALALARRLPQKHAELARGEFHQWPATRSLDGAGMGILGFGGIGKATARLARAFGMRIQAVNTSGRTDEPVEFVGTLADLDAVLAAVDVLVIALPLTRQTRGMIGVRELSLMRPDAILVNVARGVIVDQAALYEHLRTHPDFMAGIDAWWSEPFGQGEFKTDHPFFELPNLLGSPHNSAIVPGIELKAARRAAANVARHLRGEPVAGLVRREDY